MCVITIGENHVKSKFDDKKVLLKNYKIKKSIYQEVLNKQYKYTCEKKSGRTNIFENRFSYRGDMKSLSEREVEDIVKKMAHAKDYRPTPLPGNLDCIKIAIMESDGCRLFFLDDERLYTIDGEAEKLFKYLQSLTVRPDIRGNGGTYFFPMINLCLLEKKYRYMAEPLAFITIGCLFQNFTLLFNENNICSCIHYGVKEYREWKLGDELFFIPCLLRAGHAEIH